MTRVSYATWAVDGPKGRVLIRRINNKNYVVGHAARPILPGFFSMKSRLKRDALDLAQKMAGIQ